MPFFLSLSLNPASSAFDSPETIELEINTDSSEGLILWQGVVSPPAVRTLETHSLLSIHVFKPDTHSLTSSSPNSAAAVQHAPLPPLSLALN